MSTSCSFARSASLRGQAAQRRVHRLRLKLRSVIVNGATSKRQKASADIRRAIAARITAGFVTAMVCFAARCSSIQSPALSIRFSIDSPSVWSGARVSQPCEDSIRILLPALHPSSGRATSRSHRHAMRLQPLPPSQNVRCLLCSQFGRRPYLICTRRTPAERGDSCNLPLGDRLIERKRRMPLCFRGCMRDESEPGGHRVSPE